MINIRNIITALLVVSTILLISCSQGDNSENITGGYFGYNSKYNGYTNHAVFRSYEESEKIAKELVNGINQSNKIYNNTLKALMPQLYLDNGTTYIREEGTCINKVLENTAQGFPLPLLIMYLLHHIFNIKTIALIIKY